VDEERLSEFVKGHMAWLLKANFAVLGELERQEEADLSVKVRSILLASLNSAMKSNLEASLW
jgi:hypothetical protein